jgi:hypothetical protein
MAGEQQGYNDRWFCTRCSLLIFEDSILTLRTCHSSGVIVRFSRSGKLLLALASTVLVSMGPTLRREEGSDYYWSLPLCRG